MLEIFVYSKLYGYEQFNFDIVNIEKKLLLNLLLYTIDISYLLLIMVRIFFKLS